MSNTRTQDEGMVRPLTKHQIAYAERRAKGEGKRDPRLDKLPQVQALIRDIRDRASATAAYDVSKAMVECDQACSFAYEKGNAMALVKALELKAKLAGLLIERIQVETVDLTAALNAARERAEARVKLVNVPPTPALIEARESVPVLTPSMKESVCA